MNKTFILLILATILFALVTETQPCSCLPSSLEEDVKRAALIFTGVVKDIKEIEPQSLRITLDLITVWKGPRTRRKKIRVRTGANSAMCGFNFELNRNYLVYAYSDFEDNFAVSICGRTNLLEFADGDLDYLKQRRGRFNN